MRLVYPWLGELVPVPGDVDALAATLALRGFEVASIERGPMAVIDLEITANRPDCLNMMGLAREASAAYGLPIARDESPGDAKPQGPPWPAAAPMPPLDVLVEDPGGCPRYCAQLFEVRTVVTSPAWMRERLEAAGIRAIGPIVDVTNYVMLEMGQPTHAFDYGKLKGGALHIRRAKRGETLRTLDGVARTLDPDMLVIADADRAQAVAGVMGGADSEIGPATRLMVLESACFTPAMVRRTSKRLGLRTEASVRFERGADIDGAPAAIARAAALLAQIGAARPGGPMIDRYAAPRAPLTIVLRASRIERVLGVAVPETNVPRMLEPLGFRVNALARHEAQAAEAGTSWSVTVPSFRVDVQREVDLIEEVARHDGYAGLPATFPRLIAAQQPPDRRTLRDRLVRQVMTACGASEAMTFAFIDASAAAPFAEAGAVTAIANPLSDIYGVLRPSLLPGLIAAAAHNRRRERPDVRLFETGIRFTTAGETRGVAGVWCGAASDVHWSVGARPADFYDVKGVVGALGSALGVTLDVQPASVSYMVPGRTAEVSTAGGTRLGAIGQISPTLLDARGFPSSEPLYAFELDLDAIGEAQSAGDLRAESLPRFPSIVRDLSVLVDSTLPAASVRGTIRSVAPATLATVLEFDRYRGKGVPEGRVSLSLRLTFRSADRTLTDAEIDEAMTRVVAVLASAHGAVRR